MNNLFIVSLKVINNKIYYGGFMKKIKLGIVGASGLVGQTVLKVLKEEQMLEGIELILITSDKNAGKIVEFDGKKYEYIQLNEKCLDLGLNFVIFSAGDNISKLWAQNFAKKGAYVIDNSNAFRREKDIPLVVPEINVEKIDKNSKIIANPNCSTIQLALVLFKLRQIGNIEKVIVSSYQSVSGAGKEALDDLALGTQKVFNANIKENVIPCIGDIEDNGFCKEENKIMFETKKILDVDFDVLATTARVPVPYCHGESVYIKFSQKVNILSVKNMLKCKFIKISDKIIHNSDVHESNLTYICRLRQSSENEIMFWVLADNLRRGAAFNAVLILKHLINYFC